MAGGLAVMLGALTVMYFSARRRHSPAVPLSSRPRIVLPIAAYALPESALDAALRLANEEMAVLVPVFLQRVPMRLALDARMPREWASAFALEDAIEQRALVFGVTIDPQVQRARTYRDALRLTIANQRFNRLVIAVAPPGEPGFTTDEATWLLSNTPGEIDVLGQSEENQVPGVVLRPAAPGTPLSRERTPRAVAEASGRSETTSFRSRVSRAKRRHRLAR